MGLYRNEKDESDDAQVRIEPDFAEQFVI